MTPYTVTLEGSLRWGTLPKLIRNFQGCIAATTRSFRLDLSQVRFCHPVGLVCMAAETLHPKRKGYELIETVHPVDEAVKRYLTRIDFYDAIETPSDLTIQRRDSAGHRRPHPNR